jgi:hypothetical protein
MCPQASDADPQTEALRSSIGTLTLANLAEAGNLSPQRGVGGDYLTAVGPPDRQVRWGILPSGRDRGMDVPGPDRRGRTPQSVDTLPTRRLVSGGPPQKISDGSGSPDNRHPYT